MLSNNTDNDIPQWKKDLLQRRQYRSKTAPSLEQLLSTRAPHSSSVTVGRAVQQPSPTCNSNAAVAVGGLTKSVHAKCNKEQTCSVDNPKMVQERAWSDHNSVKTYELVSRKMDKEKSADSDSSEELQYGPGIVNRLKNRFLSLTLREATVRTRPSILHMRKAASLEHLIDDDDEEDYDEALSDKGKSERTRLFETKINGSNGIPKNVPNRYKNTARRFDMKRARSVEIISSADDNCVHSGETRPKRESLHEEVYIKTEGSDKANINDKKMSEINDIKMFSNHISLRLNRPKRITPVMNEREKPPIDVVKETKKLFERPELRTKPPVSTGEVAAKVACYKSIIVQTKNSKKPPIRQKPVIATNEKLSLNKKSPVVMSETDHKQKPEPVANNKLKSVKPPLRLPVKSVFNEVKNEKNNVKTTTETIQNHRNSPDVATLPSPIPDISNVNENHSPDGKVNGFARSSLSETPDLILHSSHSHTISVAHKDATEDFLKAEISHSSNLLSKINLARKSENHAVSEDTGAGQTAKKLTPETQKTLSVNGNSVVFNFSASQLTRNYLPNIQAQSQSHKIPLNQPLTIEVGGANYVENKLSTYQPKHSPQVPKPQSPRATKQLKQLSPQLKQLSPKPKQLSPPSRQLSPPSRQLSPPSKQLSPPSRQLSPPSKNVSPPSDQLAPPAKNVSPPSNQLAPPSKNVSPPPKQLSPPSNQLSPPLKNVSPQSNQLSPPSNQLSPPPKQLPPPSNQLSPPSKNVSPQSNQLSPPSKNVSPPSNQLSPPSKNVSPSNQSSAQTNLLSPQSKPLPQFPKPHSPQASKIPSPQLPKSPPHQITKTPIQMSKPPSSPPPKFCPSKPQSPQLSKSSSAQVPKSHSSQIPSKKPPLHSPKHHSPALIISQQKIEPPPCKSNIPGPIIKDILNTAVPSDLSERVIEKNLINAAKTIEKPVDKNSVSAQQSESAQAIEVPRVKRTPPRPKQEQNSLVFNFTDRKDVPDYVGNHGPIRTGKIERPKPGEGGITLLPGVSLDESVVDDDDEEWLRSLEGPPSPCNVTFINDNILIDGRSSLSQKTKKPKMRIKFLDAGPDIYEYPSEASLLEETPSPATNSTPVGHTVPSLSGSTLANYTPKSSFPSEEFQLGMKPTTTPTLTAVAPEAKRNEDSPEDAVMHETEQPILFSAGTNSDILF